MNFDAPNGKNAGLSGKSFDRPIRPVPAAFSDRLLPAWSWTTGCSNPSKVSFIVILA